MRIHAHSSRMEDDCQDSWLWISTPIGPVLLRGREHYATGIFLKDQQYFPDRSPAQSDSSPSRADSDVLLQLANELQEYFSGNREQFETEFELIGSPFQIAVWRQLATIPFGCTTTYGQIAHQIGKGKASRAIGAAIGRNPLSIVLPCHRVIGKSGSLTGYAGGLDRKRWLLELERGRTQASLSQRSFAFV